MVKLIFFLSISIFTISVSKCGLKPRVVGGQNADITKFPHSAFLYIECVQEIYELSWICGASIVNQQMLLTACHCVHKCVYGSTFLVKVGSVNKEQDAKMLFTYSYLCHENFSENSLENDIALLKLEKPLKFNNKIKRVVLLKKPPHKEKAEIAGWGLINEIEPESTEVLQYTEQFVWNRNACEDKILELPPGVICASNKQATHYAAMGDSGSALVVRGYIQIGLVSWKKLSLRHVTVYTDVGYHYDWIVKSSKILIC